MAATCAVCVMLHATQSLPFERPNPSAPTQDVTIVTTPVPGMTPSITMAPNRRSIF